MLSLVLDTCFLIFLLPLIFTFGSREGGLSWTEPVPDLARCVLEKQSPEHLLTSGFRAKVTRSRILASPPMISSDQMRNTGSERLPHFNHNHFPHGCNPTTPPTSRVSGD